MSEARSWILETRRRLENPPPRPAAGTASRLVILVPLFVVESSLWSLFTIHRPRRAGDPSLLGLVGAPIQESEERWEVAAKVAEEQLAVDASRVLRLGDLDACIGLENSEILPCVAAVPGPRPGEQPMVPPGLLGAPLAALRETGTRVVEELGVEYPVLTLRPFPSTSGPQLGAVELWGPPASILVNLLRRLGVSPCR